MLKLHLINSQYLEDVSWRVFFAFISGSVILRHVFHRSFLLEIYVLIFPAPWSLLKNSEDINCKFM